MIILINNWVPKFPKQAEYKLFKIVVQGNVKRESERAREPERKKKSLEKVSEKVNL